MKFDPQNTPSGHVHHRRSIRLQGHDYTQSGAYYVTIVTYQRGHFFGEVVHGEMRLNELGQIAHDEWLKTAVLRPYVKLYEDEFVVMPNHVHGIIWIERGDGGNPAVTAPTVQPKSLGAIVRAYKSAVTYAVNVFQNQRGAVLWQRNYYEHIIRDQEDYLSKSGYILNNPRNWEDDDENK